MFFLVLIITEIECRSRSDHHEFNYPSFPHKTDQSRWTPFGRDENNLMHESSTDKRVNSSSTESSSSLRKNEDESSKLENFSNLSKSESSSSSPAPSSPIVNIDWGTIEGVIETYAGSNVSVFYGIPYAEPPVGKLRFRLPVPLEGRYQGVYNATTRKPACFQLLTGTPIDEPISEDCLHMNIWVPRDHDDEHRSRWSSYIHHRYPVLFYIYGSQFKKHSSTFPINRGGVTAAKGKMIFVGFNYRIQSFGFAYGGDRNMPGNQALYDMLAALEWTRKNIAAFGGDPDKITIAGSSTGSEFAAILALSPIVSPFLFDQVILMSAVPMRPASIESTSTALKKTKALAAKLGCGNSSDYEFRLTYEQIECLQAANATEIAEADTTDDITILGNCPDFAFMPIYGDDFMPSPPDVILSKKEARRNMKFMVGSDHNEDVNTGNYSPASRAEAEGHLDSMLINSIKPKHNISRELSYLYDYYFEDVNDNDTWSLKERLSQLIGDNTFQCPLLLSMEKWATLNPIHYYYYNYTADAFANSTEVRYQHGPPHGSANFMFLGEPFKKDTYSDRDRHISSQMIKILSDFVREGEIPWPPMLVSRRNKVLPLEWVIDERVDTHNIKVNPKLNICRFIAKLYQDDF